MKPRLQNKFSSLIFIIIATILITINLYSSNIVAVGPPSTNMYLSVSAATINIGKTFNITLMVNGENIDIAGFDAQIKFDATKLDIIKSGTKPSIIKPASVPSGFLAPPNLIGDTIYISGEDTTLESPVKARGATALVTFSFKVKESASVNTTASFSILERSVTSIYKGAIDSAIVTVSSPKKVTIGPKLETNAFLSSLSIEGAVLSPEFDKNVMNYKASVPKEVTSVKVSTQKESTKSTVSVTGTTSLDYGDNTVTITVTAQDTDVARRYKITVTRAFPDATPTTAISSQDVSSETISAEPTVTEIIATPTAEATPEPTPVPKTDERQLNFWKILTVVFAGLFVITLCILIWVIIDRNSMRDVKIRRL